jgi:hypothetical protein
MANKINIGDTLCDEKRNYTITDRKTDRKYKDGKLISWKTKYKYKCNICGYDCSHGYRGGKYLEDIWVDVTQVTRGDRCACCYNRVIVPEINSIYALRKDLLPYFQDINEAKMYSVYSNVTVHLKCPFCGEKKDMLLTNFVQQGFSCPKCSDNMPLGEKMIYCILNELGVDFVKEMNNKTCFWAKNYRYDFYIENINAIIEVNGRQHYSDGGLNAHKNMSFEKQIQNDKNKYELAMKNGISNYIIINASKTDFNFIKTSILKSKLNDLYDLSKIDWTKIMKETATTLAKRICDIWRENPEITLTDMKQKFKLSRGAIDYYLRLGNELKWCKYTGSIHGKNSHSENPILCLDNNIYFENTGICAKYSEKIFGRKIESDTIKYSLNNPENYDKNLPRFRYITKQEFNDVLEKGLKCYGSRFNI